MGEGLHAKFSGGADQGVKKSSPYRGRGGLSKNVAGTAQGAPKEPLDRTDTLWGGQVQMGINEPYEAGCRRGRSGGDASTWGGHGVISKKNRRSEKLKRGKR